ncbi:MAG TPA: isoprenylcysteine carboxylmethyltransferase family protein [Marmoricola sp.]|nr:isoprenylcysteine carboxylmethyltransferase family protein [Marmoricola sp.]
MRRRPLDLALSAAAWTAFNAVMVWTMVFLAEAVVPRTVDGPARVSGGLAVVTDVALLLLFAVQHSLMARGQAKTWLRRLVPESLERTVYVLATDACLVLLLVGWQPFGPKVWDIGGIAAAVVWTLCGLGWSLAIASTYAVDHFELTGLRQAGWLPPRESTSSGLQVNGLHRLVRHPLMTGLLVAFWATPRMGASHLLFAAVMTAYVAIGVHFEERDLRRTFGAEYDDYAIRVPALIPGARVLRRRSRGAEQVPTVAPRVGEDSGPAELLAAGRSDQLAP